MLLPVMSLSTYRPIRRARIAVLLAAALWIPAAALSQETPPEEPAVEPPEIQAIPLEDVQEKAEAVSAELETMLPGDALRQSLEEIGGKLERLKEDTASLVELTTSTLAAGAGVARLQEMELQLVRPAGEPGRAGRGARRPSHQSARVARSHRRARSGLEGDGRAGATRRGVGFRSAPHRIDPARDRSRARGARGPAQRSPDAAGPAGGPEDLARELPQGGAGRDPRPAGGPLLPQSPADLELPACALPSSRS